MESIDLDGGHGIGDDTRSLLDDPSLSDRLSLSQADRLTLSQPDRLTLSQADRLGLHPDNNALPTQIIPSPHFIWTYTNC